MICWMINGSPAKYFTMMLVNIDRSSTQAAIPHQDSILKASGARTQSPQGLGQGGPLQLPKHTAPQARPRTPAHPGNRSALPSGVETYSKRFCEENAHVESLLCSALSQSQCASPDDMSSSARSQAHPRPASIAASGRRVYMSATNSSAASVVPSLSRQLARARNNFLAAY